MRKKWYLIIIPFLAFIAAIFFTKDFKRMFKSTAQISTGFTLDKPVSVTEERFSIIQSEIKFNNLRERMISQRVFGMLSYQLLLHDLDESNVPYRDLIKTEKVVNKLKEVDLNEVKQILTSNIDSLKLINAYEDKQRKILDLLEIYEYDYETLGKRLNLYRVDKTDYFQIDGFTENPTLSADMVNILCQEFFRYDNFIQTDQSSVSVKNFKKLVGQKEVELKNAEENLRQYKSENGIINLDAASESKIGQITELENSKEEENQNIRAIKLELSKVERELNQIANRQKKSNGPDLLEIRKKIIQLNEKFLNGGDNAQIYKDSLNYYRSLRDKTLNYSSNSELKETRDDLQTRLDIAKQHVSSVNRRLSVLNRDIGIDANIQAKLATLEREVTRSSEEYLASQEKYNTALDLATVSSGSLRQILYGQPAMAPEPSKKIIITALSAVASFVFCIIAIILLEYIDVSIKSPFNFGKIYEAHLIGSLNKIKAKKVKVEDLFTSEKKKVKKYELIFREQLRKVRYEIQNSKSKIILVTSNQIGEGKSLLIEALAKGLSHTQKKVLIIDANFSNNSLTETYGANKTLEAIASGNDTNLNAKEQISNSTTENVDIVGCNGGDYSPSEIFDFPHFKKVMDELSENYDFVLIESAALNFYTDAKELAQFSDKVIAVYSAESVVKEQDKESMNFLNKLGNKFLGVVLNKVNIQDIN